MPNNGCTRNAKKSRRNVNPWGNSETVSSASTPTKSPGPWTKSWGPKRGSVGPGRQRRDEIRFGLKEGQAAGAASSAGRPPHISGPILANLPIFGSTWPACFVTGRAKDACFPPRWLGNGQQPGRHRPMADDDARADSPPLRVPSRSRDTLHRPGSAHRHKQKQGHPAIPALSDSSLHQDSKNRNCASTFYCRLSPTTWHPVCIHSQRLPRLLASQIPSSDLSAFGTLHLRCADALLADWRLAPPWDHSLPKVPPTTLASSPTHRYRQLQPRKPDKESTPCRHSTHE